MKSARRRWNEYYRYLSDHDVEMIIMIMRMKLFRRMLWTRVIPMGLTGLLIVYVAGAVTMSTAFFLDGSIVGISAGVGLLASIEIYGGAILKLTRHLKNV